MPAFNFQKRFASKIELGEKTQTIRNRRKDRRDPQVGQTAYLYFGMRTKSCRKLGEGKITSVETLTIKLNGYCADVYIEAVGYGQGFPLNYREMENLAKADGFENFDEMYMWFAKTHGLPFYGFLIKWDKEKP